MYESVPDSGDDIEEDENVRFIEGLRLSANNSEGHLSLAPLAAEDLDHWVPTFASWRAGYTYASVISNTRENNFFDFDEKDLGP